MEIKKIYKQLIYYITLISITILIIFCSISLNRDTNLELIYKNDGNTSINCKIITYFTAAILCTTIYIWNKTYKSPNTYYLVIVFINTIIIFVGNLYRMEILEAFELTTLLYEWIPLQHNWTTTGKLNIISEYIIKNELVLKYQAPLVEHITKNVEYYTVNQLYVILDGLKKNAEHIVQVLDKNNAN